MSEKKVEAYLRTEIRRIGGECLKWTSPGANGVPDRIVIYKGQARFVELKREEGGVLTALQRHWLDKLARLGMDARVIKSKEEVDLFVSEIQST